jgi:hypothetical protein
LFNRIESDAGFRVKIRIYSGYVEYREGQHVATIGVDRGTDVLALISANAPVKWNPPYESELISEERRKEILDNVVAALRFRKVSVELV